MKYLILFFIFLTACTTTKPKLKVGSCYDISVYGTTYPGDPYPGSTAHELSQFKIVKIFEYEGRPHYAIQILADEWKNHNHDLVPLYPSSKSYGYSAVDEFDKYIAPVASQFSPSWESKVKCNPITDEDVEKNEKLPRQPLMRVGSDRSGDAK